MLYIGGRLFLKRSFLLSCKFLLPYCSNEEKGVADALWSTVFPVAHGVHRIMTLAPPDGCADLMGRTDRQWPSRESAKLRPGQWLPVAIWGSLMLASEPEWVGQSEPLSLLYNNSPPGDSRRGPYWFEAAGLQCTGVGPRHSIEGSLIQKELFQQNPMTLTDRETWLKWRVLTKNTTATTVAKAGPLTFLLVLQGLF